MRRIFQLAALLVVTVWLPATVHCGLETALDWETGDCCDDHSQEAPDAADHCALEDGDYRATNPTIHVAAPDLLTYWYGHVVYVSQPVHAPKPALDFTTVPPELAHTWQFAARAAWPARAPSRVS